MECKRCKKKDVEYYNNGGRICKECTKEVRMQRYYEKEIGIDHILGAKRTKLKKQWIERRQLVKDINAQTKAFNKARQIELGLATCQKCKKEKPLSEYSKDRTNPRGIQRKCKSCAYKSVRRSIDQRIQNDKAFKYRYNMSIKIANAYRNGFKKKCRTQDVLGCTYEQLKNWLNSVSEYIGEDAHLDHVVPASCATTQKEADALNHYSNLQLLSPYNNLSKSNKWVKMENLSRVLQHHPNPKLIKKIVSRSGFDIY